MAEAEFRRRFWRSIIALFSLKEIKYIFAFFSKIKLWADRLEVHPRTVTRLLERVEQEGLASLVRFTRIDAGEKRGSK
jgi:Mn-dependent DtxR family transcriptional regulator